MRSFWSEPYLWVHLAGVAAAPIFLELCLLGLAASQKALPSGLVLLLVAIAGIGPIAWMQWQRPFSIFSLVVLALKPKELTETQRRILRRFKAPIGRVVTVAVSIVALLILWQLNQWVPLVTLKAGVVPGGVLGGLLLAMLAFLLSNLFLQVPASVLQVLLTPEQQFALTEPYPVTQISGDFTLLGLRVKQILPAVVPAVKPVDAAETSAELERVEKLSSGGVEEVAGEVDSLDARMAKADEPVAEAIAEIAETEAEATEAEATEAIAATEAPVAEAIAEIAETEADGLIAEAIEAVTKAIEAVTEPDAEAPDAEAPDAEAIDAVESVAEAIAQDREADGREANGQNTEVITAATEADEPVPAGDEPIAETIELVTETNAEATEANEPVPEAIAPVPAGDAEDTEAIAPVTEVNPVPEVNPTAIEAAAVTEAVSEVVTPDTGWFSSAFDDSGNGSSGKSGSGLDRGLEATPEAALPQVSDTMVTITPDATPDATPDTTQAESLDSAQLDSAQLDSAQTAAKPPVSSPAWPQVNNTVVTIHPSDAASDQTASDQTAKGPANPFEPVEHWSDELFEDPPN